MHKVKAILDAFEVQLNTIPGLDVIRNRTLDPVSFPSVSLRMAEDEETERTSNEQIFTLSVETEVYVLSTNSGDLDGELLDQRSAIHQAIKSIQNLGKSYVLSVTLQGQNAPTMTNIGDKPTGVLLINWRVEYTSQLNTPEE